MEVSGQNTKLLKRQSDHRFYFGMGVFLTVLAFLGFWQTYFNPLMRGTYNGSVFLHVHAVVFFGWMAMFLLQSSLVIRRKTPVHRKVGKFGIYFGGAMLVIGLVVSTMFFGRLERDGIADSFFEAILIAAQPFMDIAQFAVVLALAYLQRKNPPFHRRYMLLATLGIMPAATGRLYYLIGPWSLEIFFVLFAVLLLLHDTRVHGAVHRANIVGLLILLPRVFLALALKVYL